MSKPGCVPAYEISSRVDRAFANSTVVLRLIPGRVKPKTIKNGIQSNSKLTYSKKKEECEL